MAGAPCLNPSVMLFDKAMSAPHHAMVNEVLDKMILLARRQDDDPHHAR
jgi:ABC-type histidine transport system ATPase subunit